MGPGGPATDGSGAGGRWTALLALLGFALLAVVLTWPMAASPGRAIADRGDYDNNVWNVWWMGTSLLEHGATPYRTDQLHFPYGISLARHTLSPLNALAGAVLARVLDLHAVIKLLLLAHFALAGWVFYLFARELSGSTAGALIAGLVWSFGPYHFYYLAQMNLATLEFLPLAGWMLARLWRRGGLRPALGLALAAGALAATSSYYLVYAALLGALMLAGARLWAPEVPFARGLRRVLPAGLLAAGLVALVAWPLLSETLGAAAAGGGGGAPAASAARSNDLLGFAWVGPPEQILVSWPTMLGWSTLALLLAGWRRGAAQLFWLGVFLVAFALGLGDSLHVGGHDTGLPLPGRLLAGLPLLSMLRKPDRFFVLMQMAVAMLCALGWSTAVLRAGRRVGPRALLAIVATLVAVERAAVPLMTFPVQRSPALAQLDEGSGEALVDLPPHPGIALAARYNLAQTVHGRKIVQGSVTNLALTAEHRADSADWQRAWNALARGDATRVAELARARGVELVALHKTTPIRRAPGALDGRTVWAPFVLVRRELLEPRQQGHVVDAPMNPAELAHTQRALAATFGPPLAEDEFVAVYSAR